MQKMSQIIQAFYAMQGVWLLHEDKDALEIRFLSDWQVVTKFKWQKINPRRLFIGRLVIPQANVTI
jgi:hypothetical protein